MTIEQCQKVKEVYDELSACEPAERAARLEALCSEDRAVRAEVEQLLEVRARASDFLEHPPQLEFTQGQAGKQIGAYQLLREIGRGGMGTVYLAERTDDVHRKQVAVKLVWPGFDSAEIFKRFRQERHILAELDHPNIARLLDGGTTDEGWPYVVMEYVAGEPITQYCNQRKLSVTERLGLFQQVCAAVSYAHRNGVIHRDLKPSNILVVPIAEGNAGTAKLLDFGIAKILDPALRTDALSLTNTGLQAMTPEYASPEQVNGQNITIATDVYSLGVLLYELLTGHLPYRFPKRVLHEVMRVITEQEPLRPSQACSPAFRRNESAGTLLPEGGTTNASQDNAQENTPDKLRRRLEGDLDNIILKAMRKEPERRYASVEQYSEDIARHMSGKPVLAQAPTLVYLSGKFIRRNKVGVAFAAFVVMALVAAVIFAGRQWRADRARARENLHAQYAVRMNQAVQERGNFNVEGVREAVESYLPGPGEEDLRGFEWYYLWRWYNRDLLTLPHDRAVESVNVVENSPYVFTSARMGGSSQRTRYVWNAETGKLLHAVPHGVGATNPVLFFLPGGFAVQQSGKQAFRVWQLGTGKEITPAVDTLSPIAASIISCADYADYRSYQLFTASENGIIQGWNLATGALLCTIKTTAPVSFVGLSPKHQRLAVNAGDNRLEFWNLLSRRLIHAVNEPAPVTAADLEAVPNSTATRGLLYVGNGIVKRFDWFTGREFQKLVMEKNSGNYQETSGGKFFSFDGSSEVQITDLLTGHHLGELKGHEGWVRSVELNPQETVAVTASADRTIRLWDFQTRRQLAVIPAHEREVWQARFSHDGNKLMTASADRTAKIWDVASLLVPDTLEGHTQGIFAVAFSPDSRRLASAGQDRTVKLWDVQTGKLLNTLPGHNHDIFKLAFSPSGDRLASVSEDKTVRIWDMNTGQSVHELKSFNTRPRAVTFSPDGKLLAVGSDYVFGNQTDDRTIRIWDVATWRELTLLKGHLGDVVAIDFSPDGKRLASASWDNTARVWDVASGRELLRFNGHKEHVWSLRFSPDGRRIATGSTDRTIKIWDAATGKELLPPRKGHSGDIFGLAFSPDGNRLASGSQDGTVKLWDVATGRELVTFKDHLKKDPPNEVWSVAFSPDGQTLASGSWDKTIRLYRAATEREVRRRMTADLRTP